MSLSIWIWLGATVFFGAVEAATAGLVSIWFVVGSVAALIAAALDGSVWLQIVVFAVVSAAALAVTRPLVRRFTKSDPMTPTNADRVLGQTAKVSEAVDNENARGAVYVDGKTWSARSASGAVIPAGTQVRVERMEGVKLYVEPIKETEEIK